MAAKSEKEKEKERERERKKEINPIYVLAVQPRFEFIEDSASHKSTANQFRFPFQRSVDLNVNRVIRARGYRLYNSSGRQTIRIKAGVPLRLLAHVILYVEFGIVRIASLLCSQFSSHCEKCQFNVEPGFGGGFHERNFVL